MTSPRLKGIPKRTRAKMLALCHIAGVKAIKNGWGFGDNSWLLSVSDKPAVRLSNSAGYNKWKQAVRYLVLGNY